MSFLGFSGLIVSLFFLFVKQKPTRELSVATLFLHICVQTRRLMRNFFMAPFAIRKAKKAYSGAVSSNPPTLDLCVNKALGFGNPWDPCTSFSLLQGGQ